MSTEIAVKLSTNGHKRPPPGNTPRTVPGRSFVPLPRNDRSRSVNPYANPPSADLRWPLNKALPRAFDKVRPRAAEPRGADDVRRGGSWVRGLGGLDLEGDQGIRVGQVGELADDATGDD